jgi:hypothetical protein
MCVYVQHANDACSDRGLLDPVTTSFSLRSHAQRTELVATGSTSVAHKLHLVIG